ncbi:nuclease domain-containing protein [Shewanella fodinae]|uniref:nuclease domain-containing protein n=1 Tax=Shewanella fodinae TaxID=552357 RepID=UPI00167464EA|nr:nuclease domain-containing protein [Shewanella fodinae]MCL2905211.1 DUF1364 domain-containing protein [Shewanella fodinae]GGY87738.1 hypothetical protein GCM10007169_01130 [Shewanella fodinae]
MTARSKHITDSAKGQSCTVRLPGICNGNNETVVFAHIGHRRGMGIKCADYFGVYACEACHSEVDRRTRHMSVEDLQPELLRALEETQERLFDAGLLIVE